MTGPLKIARRLAQQVPLSLRERAGVRGRREDSESAKERLGRVPLTPTLSRKERGTLCRQFARVLLSIAAALGLGIAALFPIAAIAGERVGDVEVNVLPLPSKDNRSGGAYGTTHGYVEFRVQLKNSSTEDRIVHLSYPGTRDGWVSDGAVVVRTVHVAGGQEVLVSLYQPPLYVARETLEVRVEGVRESKYLSVASLFGHDYDPGGAVRTTVLLSRNVPQDFRDIKIAKTETAPGTKPAAPSETPPAAYPYPTAPAEPEQFAFLRSELPVGQWSPNWLGYSCYDAIVLTGKEAEEMPPQVQLAVRRWVECGGTLLIHGHGAPAAFSQGGAADGEGSCWVGLGRVIAGLDDGEANWEPTYKKLADASKRVPAYQPMEKPGNLYDLLIAEATVPVRGLFALVLLFGVGIGPANLWLLSRYKRRIWLWWNVPVISLLTCLAVFGYSLASEGFTGRGKTASMTLLDERCHRATTFGYISYYCPLTPSVGPRFGVDTDEALLEHRIDPVRRFRSRGQETGLRFVDWTSDQHLTSGWVAARVPAYFQFRKNEDRRERLTVEKKADGSLKIVNALGADIRRLYVADASGRVFEGRDIPAGAERTLADDNGAPRARGAGPPAERIQRLLRLRLARRFPQLHGRQDPRRHALPQLIRCLSRQVPVCRVALAGRGIGAHRGDCLRHLEGTERWTLGSST